MKTGVRIYLFDTILNKLFSKGVQSHEVDVRYLTRWFKLYPDIFPKFMLRNCYQAYFNWELMRWEIVRQTNLITGKY